MINKKIVVVGNCQSRPIADLVSRRCNAIITAIIINHLEKEENYKQAKTVLEESDLILVQRTDPRFPVIHASSSHLKEAYPSKTVIYPNAFWLGQTPWIRYLTNIHLGRLLGPLDAYHDLMIFQDWKKNRGLRWLDQLPTEEQTREKSLNDLKSRETECDVIISDICESDWQSKRLFFTFNHPSNYLLAKLVERIANKAELSLKEPVQKAEYLDRVIAPSPHDKDEQSYQGFKCAKGDNGKVSCSNRLFYTKKSLVDCFYDIYDHYLEGGADMENVRITPPIP